MMRSLNGVDAVDLNETQPMDDVQKVSALRRPDWRFRKAMTRQERHACSAVRQDWARRHHRILSRGAGPNGIGPKDMSPF